MRDPEPEPHQLLDELEARINELHRHNMALERALHSILFHIDQLCDDQRFKELIEMAAELLETKAVGKTYPYTFDQSKRQALVDAMSLCNGNRKQVAQKLQVCVRSIGTWLRKYGITES